MYLMKYAGWLFPPVSLAWQIQSRYSISQL